jgi:hypothetical protein
MTNVAAVPFLEQARLFLPFGHTFLTEKPLMYPKRREKWNDGARGTWTED